MFNVGDKVRIAKFPASTVAGDSPWIKEAFINRELGVITDIMKDQNKYYTAGWAHDKDDTWYFRESDLQVVTVAVPKVKSWRIHA